MRLPIAIYIIAPFVLAIVIFLLIKIFGSKYSTTTEEVHRKVGQSNWTWDGVFGFLFFIVAEALGASLLISLMMLAVGIVVGDCVKRVVDGLKEKKDMGRDNESKEE